MLKGLPRRDRAFLLAKICAEKGKTTSSNAMAKEAALARIISYVESGDYAHAERLAKRWDAIEETRELVSKVKEHAIRVAKMHLSRGTYGCAEEIAKKYGVIDETREAALEKIKDYRNRRIYDRAAKIAKAWGITQEMREAACEGLLLYLEKKGEMRLKPNTGFYVEAEVNLSSFVYPGDAKQKYGLTDEDIRKIESKAGVRLRDIPQPKPGEVVCCWFGRYAD